MRTTRAKILENVAIDASSGCWNWTASQNGAGYGQIAVERKPRLAHRISYELHRGLIPHGMFVCHHCDNRACVNPDHLFLGTAADNAADRDNKGRQIIYSGSKHGSSKLTEEEVAEIRSSREPHRAIGQKFGISGSQVSRIRTGKQRSVIHGG